MVPVPPGGSYIGNAYSEAPMDAPGRVFKPTQLNGDWFWATGHQERRRIDRLVYVQRRGGERRQRDVGTTGREELMAASNLGRDAAAAARS
jgi:hypothetical protein